MAAGSNPAEPAIACVRSSLQEQKTNGAAIAAAVGELGFSEVSMRWEACMHSSSSPVLHNHDVITWQRAQTNGKSTGQ